MKTYQPPYKITKKILSLATDIKQILKSANVEAINQSSQSKKQNRIKSITGTVAIEGNRLSLKQVSTILDGKPVQGTQREIAEVRGAIKAYESLEKYQPASIKSLCETHKIMMQELLQDAGYFRRDNIGVYKNGEPIHIAPQPSRVPALMENVLNWLKSTKEQPLISSSVFHYEFEFIHPFSDGNGRMGRLWQTLILGRWQKVFYFLPIESTIKKHQQKYYDALATSNKKKDSTTFIEFMLEVILENLKTTK